MVQFFLRIVMMQSHSKNSNSAQMLLIKFMSIFFVKLLLYECHSTPLMISQHWFRYWLGAVRQQAITWDNVDPDSCHHMLPLGHNELILYQVLAWGRQATSHYLRQCWPWFMPPYVAIRSQWVNEHTKNYYIIPRSYVLYLHKGLTYIFSLAPYP